MVRRIAEQILLVDTKLLSKCFPFFILGHKRHTSKLTSCNLGKLLVENERTYNGKNGYGLKYLGFMLTTNQCDKNLLCYVAGMTLCTGKCTKASRLCLFLCISCVGCMSNSVVIPLTSH